MKLSVWALSHSHTKVFAEADKPLEQKGKMFAAPGFWFGLIFYNDDNRHTSWGERWRPDLREHVDDKLWAKVKPSLQPSADLIWSVVAVQPGWTRSRSPETRTPTLRCEDTKLNTERSHSNPPLHCWIILLPQSTFICVAQFRHKATQSALQEHTIYIKR